MQRKDNEWKRKYKLYDSLPTDSQETVISDDIATYMTMNT